HPALPGRSRVPRGPRLSEDPRACHHRADVSLQLGSSRASGAGQARGHEGDVPVGVTAPGSRAETRHAEVDSLTAALYRPPSGGGARMDRRERARAAPRDRAGAGQTGALATLYLPLDRTADGRPSV